MVFVICDEMIQADAMIDDPFQTQPGPLPITDPLALKAHITSSRRRSPLARAILGGVERMSAINS